VSQKRKILLQLKPFAEFKKLPTMQYLKIQIYEHAIFYPIKLAALTNQPTEQIKTPHIPALHK